MDINAKCGGLATCRKFSQNPKNGKFNCRTEPLTKKKTNTRNTELFLTHRRHYSDSQPERCGRRRGFRSLVEPHDRCCRSARRDPRLSADAAVDSSFPPRRRWPSWRSLRVLLRPLLCLLRLCCCSSYYCDEAHGLWPSRKRKTTLAPSGKGGGEEGRSLLPRGRSGLSTDA